MLATVNEDFASNIFQPGLIPADHSHGVFSLMCYFFNASVIGLGIMADRNSSQGEPIMTAIGVISDTHITSCTPSFRKAAEYAFSGCQVLIHVGDLTDISILNIFAGKTVYAVHGNMCNQATCLALPDQRVIILDGYTIGICHGDGPRHNIEDRMHTLFSPADCIIYGHTHIPACNRIGSTLLLNPGSFQATGRHGAPGTYALLQTDPNGINASIHELRQFT